MKNEKTTELLNLIKKYPEFEVVPMVNYEVCGDDECQWWMGSLGRCEVGVYCVFDDRFYQDKDSFQDDYYCQNEEELCKKFAYDPGITEESVSQNLYTEKQLETNNKNENLLNEYLGALSEVKFKNAIFVYIGL